MNIYLQKKQKRWNSVSVTIALSAALIGYLLWFAVPMYWPIFRMTGIMKGTCNEAFKVTDEPTLIRKLLYESRRTKLKLTKDNFRFSRVPYTMDELQSISKDTSRWVNLRRLGKECLIEFYYEDDYEWPLIGVTTHLTFEKSVREPMTAVVWEKPSYDCNCLQVKR